MRVGVKCVSSHWRSRFGQPTGAIARNARITGSIEKAERKRVRAGAPPTLRTWRPTSRAACPPARGMFIRDLMVAATRRVRRPRYACVPMCTQRVLDRRQRPRKRPIDTPDGARSSRNASTYVRNEHPLCVGRHHGAVAPIHGRPEGAPTTEVTSASSGPRYGLSPSSTPTHARLTRGARSRSSVFRVGTGPTRGDRGQSRSAGRSSADDIARPHRAA